MFTKIKKSDWLRFCKEFNQANQYRRASVKIEYESTGSVETVESSIFLGFSVSKKGRWIEEISLIVGSNNPYMIAEPVVSIYRPVNISVMKNDNGADNHIMITDGDCIVVSMSLSGDQDIQLRHVLNEELAHSVFERRGSGHGNDLDDWLEAEKIITEAEYELV